MSLRILTILIPILWVSQSFSEEPNNAIEWFKEQAPPQKKFTSDITKKETNTNFAIEKTNLKPINSHKELGPNSTNMDAPFRLRISYELFIVSASNV